MQQPTEPLADRRNFRALEIDLTVDPHQQLDRIQSAIVPQKWPALMSKLIRKVLNRMSKNLQRAARLWRNMPRPQPRLP